MAIVESDLLDVELTADGDILVDETGIHLFGGLPAIAQLCRIAILLFLGEWFLNLDAGTPWYELVLGEKYNADTIRSMLVTRLLTVPAVSAVAELATTFDPDARALTVTGVVTTQFGDTAISATLTGGLGG